MNEQINYNSLLMLTLLAFITPFIVSKIKRFKIPYQVGEIFVGILFGQSFLNIIKPDIWIVFLSHLGVAYLMFLSGLEIDFEKKNKQHSCKNDNKLSFSLIMYLVSFLVATIITIPVLKLFKIENGTMLFILLFTASAPGLLVPIFKQKHILNSEYGQYLLIFSLVSEFICLIGFSFISSVSEYGFGIQNFLFLGVFFAAYILYVLIQKIYKLHDFSALAFKNLHIGVRAAFTLILLLVSVAEKMHIEAILGSFLAGVIFSLIAGKAKEEISHQLDVIGYGFLIPIFFIMVGVELDLKSIFQSPQAILKIPVFLLIFFIVKLIPSLLLKKKFCNNKSISASFILSSQLSLAIVASQMAFDLGFIGSADYSALILTTVISCVIFPIIFAKIYKKEQFEDPTEDVDEKIIIREALVSNESYIGKLLKNCNFPIGCRIFIILRNNIEIMPSADTIIKKGDVLVLAGLKDKVNETIEILL